MTTRASVSAFGLTILGVWIVVLGAYVWPVSTDHGCPRMTLTAAEIRDGDHTGADLRTAGESARIRYECLQQKLDVGIQPWPSPLNHIQAIFLTNDLKALDSATTAAFLARRQAEQTQQEI